MRPLSTQSCEHADGCVQGLLELLEREGSLCEELRGLQEEEFTCLKRSPDETTLRLVAERKRRLLTKIASAEKERVGLIRELAGFWHMDPTELTLSEIAERTPPIRDRMRRLGSRLSRKAAEVREADTRNRAYVDRAIFYAQASVRFLETMAGRDLVSGTGRLVSRRG